MGTRRTGNVLNLVGLQRCGSHAIADWLLNQSKILWETEYIVPYKKLVHVNGDNYIRHLNKKTCNVLYNNRFFYEDKLNFCPDKKVETAVVLYEISKLSHAKDLNHWKDKNEIFTRIDNERSLLLLRRAENCFASWFKQKGEVPPHIIQHYRDRCKEILNGFPTFPNCIFINFDKWFVDVDYRKELCRKIGVYFTDIGKSRIPNFGKGSSFSGLAYNGQAELMNVNERYKEFEDNDKFQDILKRNQDLVEMSNEIFNEI